MRVHIGKYTHYTSMPFECIDAAGFPTARINEKLEVLLLLTGLRATMFADESLTILFRHAFAEAYKTYFRILTTSIIVLIY